MKTTLILVLAVGLLASLAPAQSIWDGDADPIWDFEEDTNWAGDIAPLPNDYADVIFGTGGSGADMWEGYRLNDITFNRAGDFQILANTQNIWPGPRELELYGDISVTEAYTYRISARTYRVMLKADNTIDVIAGGTMVFDTATGTPTYTGAIVNYGYTVTKTGTGLLEFTGGYGVDGLYGLGGFDVQAGTVKVTTTSPSTCEGVAGSAAGLFIATGTSLNIDQQADTDMEGVMQLDGGFDKQGTYTMTLSGAAGRVELKPGAEMAIRSGTVELDNTAANRNDRLVLIGTGTNPTLDLSGGKLHLIGNDTVASSESLAPDVVVNSGLGQIAVTHGASANATITTGTITLSGASSALKFSGNDLGATTGPGSYIMASGVTPSYGIIGGRVFVGDEFAAYDATYGVSALSATHPTRTGAVATATAGQNALVTGAQAALTGNVTVNSLKITGANALDLGGNILTIDSGGLIQDGAANTTGIHSGSLTATDRLFINAASDLVIGATLTGTSAAKIGAGKLTLGDTSLSEGVYLIEGSLDVTNSAATTVILANSRKAGTLTKAGSGVLTLRQASSSDGLTGDTYISGGTVVYNGDGSSIMGSGTYYVSNGATLTPTPTATSWAAEGQAMLPGVVSLAGGARYVYHESTLGTTMSFINVNVAASETGVVLNTGTVGYKPLRQVSGAGRLIKMGAGEIQMSMYPLDWSGFTGTLDVAEGVLRARYGHPANAAGVHVRSGATYLYTSRFDFTGQTFSGDGTVAYGGALAYSFNGNTFSPGSSDGADIGTLNIDMAGLDFGYDSDTSTKCILDIEATDSSTVDVLAVTGDVSGLDNCDVLFDLPAPSKANFDIITGVNLTFLTTSSIAGSFSAVSTVATNVGNHYSLTVADIVTGTTTVPGTAAVLMLTGTHWTGHDGDTNLDDDVDVLDLANMANNFGRGITDPGVSWLTSDYNIDGEVDVLDLAKMANNFGWSSGAGGGEAIPEPLTIAILALGAVAIIRRRRW